MVRLRPLPTGDDAVPPPIEDAHEPWDHDDLDGVEAFAPRAEGDPDDPWYAITAGGERRGREPGARETGGLAGAGLVVATIVLLAGILAAALGLPDDGDGDDLATAASSTTSSTTRAAVTTTSTTRLGQTSTTGAFAPGTSVPGPATTSPGATVTTTRSVTTLVAPSTTVAADRPLTVAISLEPAQPVAHEPVEITLRWSDPDAVPTANCLVVRIDGVVVIQDPCEEEPCPAGSPAVGASGGTRTVVVSHQFDTAGPATIEAEGRSGSPECNNPFASRGSGSVTVQVEPAA